jgi:hypothetical protein
MWQLPEARNAWYEWEWTWHKTHPDRAVKLLWAMIDDLTIRVSHLEEKLGEKTQSDSGQRYSDFGGIPSEVEANGVDLD